MALAHLPDDSLPGGDRAPRPPCPADGEPRCLAAPRRPKALRKNGHGRPEHRPFPRGGLGQGTRERRADRGSHRPGPQHRRADHDGRSAPLCPPLGEREIPPALPGQLPDGDPRPEAVGADPQGKDAGGRGPGPRVHPLSGDGLRLPVPQPLHAELHPPEGRSSGGRYGAPRPGQPSGGRSGARAGHRHEDRRHRRRRGGALGRLAAPDEGPRSGHPRCAEKARGKDHRDDPHQPDPRRGREPRAQAPGRGDPP